MAFELKDLRENYSVLAEKYKLPSFSDLNEAFEIEKIERESDCLLREIRKTMMEKIVRYIHFIEMMINPSQAPPMFMVFVKSIEKKDKEALESVYKSFIELELISLRIDIDYSEEKESEAIIRLLKAWNENKKNMNSIIDIMERNWKGSSSKKEKGYFG